MGNGFNYVREIMQMNLPDTPVEKTIKAATTEGYSRYQFIGYMDDADVLWAGDPKVVVRLRIGDRGRFQARAHTGDVIMHRNKLYAWCGDHIWLEFNPGPCTPYHGPTPDISLEPNNKEEKENMATEKVQYNRIPHGWMAIKNVVFNDPATIVMWQDGSKTVVKCGENDEYDPEKGLAMAIAKKAFGNEGNYYNQIRKWLPEMEEEESTCDITWSIRDGINSVFGDPKRANAAKKLTDIQELIVDMAFKGATKGELVRAIRFSKDLIDASKGVDIDIAKSVADLGIAELEAKYQPK